MLVKYFLIFELLIIAYDICLSQDNNCNIQKKCSHCIRIPECMWCYSMNASKCVDVSQGRDECSEYRIENPQFGMNIKQNLPAQIQPQLITVNTRQNHSFVINFTYTETKDYPVDLYFLMDLSASMSRHKDKLSKLGMTISDKMKNLTQDIRFGFGSFVDKPELPFVNTYPEKLKNPCSTQVCATPYSFINHLSLTKNVYDFTQTVNSSQLSGNLDSPEGGLDALMQVMVCQKEIGWRDKARRLIIFSTDDNYHIAGDGKILGLVEPNDYECKFSTDDNYRFGVDIPIDYYNEGMYTLRQDYPSIGQIQYKAKETNIKIIFAVTQNMNQTYAQLKDSIHEAEMCVLSDDSENIVELLETIYTNIKSSVKITHDFDSNFEVKLSSSNCPNGTVTGNEYSCLDLKEANQIHFTAEIKFNKCPNTVDFSKKYYIRPSNLNENLTIEINKLCDCTCEYDGFEHKSKWCSNSGDLKCGICECEAKKFGKQCQCDGDSEQIQNCQPEPKSGLVCSGLGDCICGTCNCHKRDNPKEIIYGDSCECDNYSCRRYNNEICAGNGRCECKLCKCTEGWSGNACECSEEIERCKNQAKNNELCSNHGDCHCNKCICRKDYFGKHCEQCSTCLKSCSDLEPCVRCNLLYNETFCKDNCALITVNFLERIEEHNCTYYNESECVFKILHFHELNYTNVFIEKNGICPQQASVTARILIPIMTIIIAGIILLIIWKGVITYKDRKEYAKFLEFENERKWEQNENPLYKKATSNFINPLYNQNNS